MSAGLSLVTIFVYSHDIVSLAEFGGFVNKGPVMHDSVISNYNNIHVWLVKTVPVHGSSFC